MTNPCLLNNVTLDLKKKPKEYDLELKCCGTNLIPAGQAGKRITIPADVDKTVSFQNPANPIRAPKTGSEVTLSWIVSVEKKGVSGDPKKYDKQINVPITGSSSPQQHTVLLGKIGSITFMADAVDEVARQQREAAELARRQQEAQNQQLAEEARRRAEEEERARLAAIEAAVRQKQADDRVAQQGFIDAADERYKFIVGEFEVSAAQIEAHRDHLRKLAKEQYEAMEWERKNRPPVWPALHAELRIAKLFMEPPEYEDDPIFDAICAPPVIPPPATNGEYMYEGGGGPLAPRKSNNSPSPARSSNNNSPQLLTGPRASDRNPSPTAIIHNSQRKTPLDIVHMDNNDPDSVIAAANKKNKFGASGLEEDFGRRGASVTVSDDGSEDGFLDHPDFQPDGKLYRSKHRYTRKFEPGMNPLVPMNEQQTLPPLDSLPRIRNVTRAEEEAAAAIVASSTSSPGKPRVSFAGDAATPAAASSAAAAAASAGNADGSPAQTLETSRANARSSNSDPQPQFEVELEPAPALMTALLHLSRNGGYMDALGSLDEQLAPAASASPQRGSATDVFTRLGPAKIGVQHFPQQVSPGRGAATGASPPRHNSMTPRRQVPLVYSSMGEVVSKTSRSDARAVPSFARPKERHQEATIRFNAGGRSDDPARSYWEAFAPGKAQGLVGVRMPASAVHAFEDAALNQVAAASPPRGLRTPGSGVRASANAQTTSPRRRYPHEEETSLRKIVAGARDAGESSSSRAMRRW